VILIVEFVKCFIRSIVKDEKRHINNKKIGRHNNLKSCNLIRD